MMKPSHENETKQERHPLQATNLGHEKMKGEASLADERASEHANKTQIDDKIITNLCKYLLGWGGLK